MILVRELQNTWRKICQDEVKIEKSTVIVGDSSTIFSIEQVEKIISNDIQDVNDIISCGGTHPHPHRPFLITAEWNSLSEHETFTKMDHMLCPKKCLNT